MDPRGTVLTEVEFTADVWTDISAYVKSSSVSRGRDTQLEQVQPGTLSAVLRNNDRTFDPSYSLGPYYGYLLPMRRIRQRVLGGGYSIVDGLTLAGNEITDALRSTGTTGDGRPRRFVSNPWRQEDVAQTTLSAAVNSAVTALPITAWQSQWPSASAFLIFVEQETMIVTGGHGTNVLTVVRGVAQEWGSAQPAASHSAGTVVTNAMTPQDGWEFKNYAAGGTFSAQAEIATAPSGNRSMKMTVHPGDYNDGADSTRERIEGYWLASGDTGQRWFYRWSDEFPLDFAANNLGSYICQIGPNHSAGNAAIYIRVTSNDKFQLGRNAGVLDTGTFIGTVTGENDFDIPVTKGVRHDFILEVDWELTATGLIRFWHREGSGAWELLLELTSLVTSSSLSGATPAIKRKHGIYRSANGSLTNYLYLSNVAQAASWEDAQFEDVGAGDSSFGIWPAATNILTGEVNQGGSSATNFTDTDYQFMGASMIRSTFDAVNDNTLRTFSGLAAATTYTASIWVDREEIDARFLKFQVRNAANSATVVETNVPRQRGLQRVSVTWTTGDTSGRVRLIATDANNLPIRCWHGRPQLELGPVATPFAGLSGTRAAARVRAPASVLNASQSWVAMRVRPGWSPSGEPSLTFERLFDWRVDSTNLITGYYSEASNTIIMRRQTGGAGSDASQTPAFNVGEEITVVFAWTASGTKVSVNGAAFSTAVNSSIPAVPTTGNIDIGQQSAGEHIAGEVVWVAAGSGTLTDADAAAFDAFGSGDKPPADTLWGSTAAPTFMWAADTREYWINADAFLFNGFVESWQQDWPDRLFQSDTTIQASDAFKVLNLADQPTSSPNVEGYDDVVNHNEPSFYYRLGEPEGTKVVTHVRKKFKHWAQHAHPGGNVHVVGVKRRRRVTRADAEGISGPAGTYKNTPTLAEPGIIKGDSDTCVRFTSASSEHVRIGPLDVGDFSSSRLTLEAWVKQSTSIGARGVVIGPESNVTPLAPIFLLGINGSGNAIGFVNSAGEVRVTGTSVLADGTWYYIAYTYDGTTQRIYVNGVEENSGTPSGSFMDATTLTPYLYIAGGPLSNAFDGWVDEPAVYEKVLSAERIAAHYEAGLRGYNQEATGTRIANAITASGLSITQDLAAGTRNILPVRQFGQSTLQPIDEAVEVEGGASMFFVAGNGTATFFDRDYQTNHPQVLVTIGDGAADEVLMEDVSVSHDESLLFNQIRIEAAEGEVQEASDPTSMAPPPEGYFPRTLERSGILFTDDADALEEATDLLALYKDPVQRIRSVVINPGMDESAYNYAILLELGDHVVVNRRPLGGEALTQDSFVEKLTHDIDFENGDWRTTLSVSGMIQVVTPAATIFALGLTTSRPRPPARTKLTPVSHTSWSPVLASHPVRLTRSR